MSHYNRTQTTKSHAGAAEDRAAASVSEPREPTAEQKWTRRRRLQKLAVSANVMSQESMAVAILLVLLTVVLVAFVKTQRDLAAVRSKLGKKASSPGDTKRKRAEKGGAGALPSVAETEALIRTRRSIFPKDYNGKAVAPAVISRMLEAANWAPTHGKTEPWRFVVFSGDAVGAIQRLKNEENLKLLTEGSEQWEYAQKKIARKAKQSALVSHLIAICMKRVKTRKGRLMPEWEEISSVACAVQNMHLVAAAAGVASYWSSGGWDKALSTPRFKRVLGLNGDGDRCLGLFHVGMSDKMAQYRASRGPWREKVSFFDDGTDVAAAVAAGEAKEEAKSAD